MGIRKRIFAANMLAATAVAPATALFLHSPSYAAGMVIVHQTAERTKAGKSVPIYDAIKMIAPPGYTISMGPGISLDEKVSWPAGGEWLDTLNKFQSASGTAYAVTLNGKDLFLRNLDAAADAPSGPTGASQPYGGPITIGVAAPIHSPGVTFLAAAPPPPPPVQAPPPAVFPIQPSAPEPAVSLPQNQPLATASSLPPSPPAQPAPQIPLGTIRSATPSTQPLEENLADASSGEVWHATGGKYLSDVIEDWAEKAGWQVVYDTRMLYEISADSDFAGSFPHAAWTVIHQMQQQIKMAGAEKPFPDIYFWKNRTAVIVTHRGLQD